MNWIETTSAFAVGRYASRFVGGVFTLIGLIILCFMLFFAFSEPGPSANRLDWERSWCKGYLSAVYQAQSNAALLRRRGAVVNLTDAQLEAVDIVIQMQSPQPAGAGKLMLRLDQEDVFCDDPGWRFK